VHQFFVASEHYTAKLIAPRGNIITSTRDPAGSIAHDLSPTILTEIIPQLQEGAAAPKGMRFIAAGIRKLAGWRAFFCLLPSTPLATSQNSSLTPATATSRSYSPTYLLAGWFRMLLPEPLYAKSQERHALADTAFPPARLVPNAAFLVALENR